MVIGGGEVAFRKIKRLLECGANVKVVTPKLRERIKELVKERKIGYLGTEYKREFLKDAFLVIGATNNQTLNARISQDAHMAHILCNIVDQPKKCSFIVPATVVRGDLIIAISTSGKSPALARKIRLGLEKSFGMEYAVFLELMGRIRDKMLKSINGQKTRRQLFKKIIDSDILMWLKHKEFSKIDAYLKETLGVEFSLVNLDFSIKDG